MARYRPEPESPPSASRIGLLVVNLGTPTAPTAAALRPYLRQFLLDSRVVETPKLIWWPILNGLILPTRPAKSAHKYATVWTDAGSPLAVYTQRQAKLLAGYLLDAGLADIEVDSAMRYGKPAIGDALDSLRQRGCGRILMLPMYPQYAASTTASTVDDMARYLLRCRNIPEMRYVRSFHDDPGYIGALAQSVREHWMRHGQGEKLVMSFHGVPRRSYELGDPYYDECHRTGQLLADALQLPPARWQLTFQSRFGRAEWLQPYTQPTLEEMARNGTRHVDLICPGFTADCLETLEEIAMECKAAFLARGGQAFNYVPCLNDRPDFIQALVSIVRRHLGGWD